LGTTPWSVFIIVPIIVPNCPRIAGFIIEKTREG